MNMFPGRARWWGNGVMQADPNAQPPPRLFRAQPNIGYVQANADQIHQRLRQGGEQLPRQAQPQQNQNERPLVPMARRPPTQEEFLNLVRFGRPENGR